MYKIVGILVVNVKKVRVFTLILV